MDLTSDTPASLFNYTTEEIKEMNPDDLLNATRQVRFKTIQVATQNGIPVENADVMKVLEDNLRGLENQALQIKKINVDEKAGKNLEAISQAVVANIIMNRPNTGRMVDTPIPNFTPPELPPSLGEATFVPGETEQVSLTTETFDGFMEKMHQD